jgi:hypothetical protein
MLCYVNKLYIKIIDNILILSIYNIFLLFSFIYLYTYIDYKERELIVSKNFYSQ